MARRRVVVDWKMVAGFGGLLFLIICVGLIGIQQIQDLGRVVDELGKVSMPRQRVILEMKSSNSKYAMGIRSYMFWRRAKYLEAAADAAKLDMVRSASKNFDAQLGFYTSLANTEEQKEWARTVASSQEDLRQLGDKIMALTDQLEDAAAAAKEELSGAIGRHLMEFEGRLFRLDAFLDDPLQKSNLARIASQLKSAEAGRIRSISFLHWSLLVGLLLGLQTAFLIYRRSRREQEHRDFLYRKMIKVEEEERNNLSLQVHDQMGQDLSALKIYLGLIEQDIPDEKTQQRERLEKTKGILDGLMQKSHNISELLRPPELEDLGLEESIAALIAQHREMTGCRYHYHRPSSEIKFAGEHSLALYRVVQEALTNISKHAAAENVEVSLQKTDDILYLYVSDDGSGFEYTEYAARPHRRQEDRVKLGLQGLKERIELLGGRLTVETKPGKGTKIQVSIPLA